jgi:hypothetical protein
MPGRAIRMVNENVELLFRDPIQGHCLPPPEGSNPVKVGRLCFPSRRLSRPFLTADLDGFGRETIYRRPVGDSRKTRGCASSSFSWCSLIIAGALSTST